MNADKKYIVLPKEDFQQMLRMASPITMQFLEDYLPKAIPDAVVIRCQDVFAGSALHTYSANIALAANLLSGAGEEDLARRMMRVADYFHERAEEADEIQRSGEAKVPG